MDATKNNSDNIPTKTLKLSNHVIYISLTNCVSKSLTNCCFPDELKVANVSPIHKDGDHLSKQVTH